MTMRLAAYISDVAGGSCRIHIMLNRMCKAPQPSRAQECPPSSISKNRNRAARPEKDQAPKAGREEIEAAHTDTLNVGRQRQQIKNDAAPHDKLREAQVASEAVQKGRESPQPWIPASACKASLIVDADEIAARGAYYRSPFLPQHEVIMTEIRGQTGEFPIFRSRI